MEVYWCVSLLPNQQMIFKNIVRQVIFPMKWDIVCWFVQHRRSVIDGHVDECNAEFEIAGKLLNGYFIHVYIIQDAFTDPWKQKEDYTNDNSFFIIMSSIILTLIYGTLWLSAVRLGWHWHVLKCIQLSVNITIEQYMIGAYEINSIHWI